MGNNPYLFLLLIGYVYLAASWYPVGIQRRSSDATSNCGSVRCSEGVHVQTVYAFMTLSQHVQIVYVYMAASWYPVGIQRWCEEEEVTSRQSMRS